MRTIKFESEGFGQYNEWAVENIKTFEKIAKLIVDIQRHPFDGLEKPEHLRGNYKGYWSRHIDDEHRLIYKITDEDIIIVSYKFHYDPI
jgi:toxin YoeB